MKSIVAVVVACVAAGGLTNVALAKVPPVCTQKESLEILDRTRVGNSLRQVADMLARYGRRYYVDYGDQILYPKLDPEKVPRAEVLYSARANKTSWLSYETETLEFHFDSKHVLTAFKCNVSYTGP